jgi:hypothetical protein
VHSLCIPTESVGIPCAFLQYSLWIPKESIGIPCAFLEYSLWIPKESVGIPCAFLVDSLWNPSGLPEECSRTLQGVLMESLLLMESSHSPWTGGGFLRDSLWSPHSVPGLYEDSLGIPCGFLVESLHSP